LRLAGTYFELKIRVMPGRTLDLDVDPNEPIGEIVAGVSEVLSLDDRPRVLCFEGARLDDATPTRATGVQDGSVLYLILVPQPHVPSLYTAYGVDDDRARVFGLVGSLYARCGGIFGVAAFIDRCMDAWMADGTLNANAAVATWHQRAQRCGFKFLVTQLMGYLCGGRRRARPLSPSLLSSPPISHHPLVPNSDRPPPRRSTLDATWPPHTSTSGSPTPKGGPS
jgi:hypothetical protein